VAGGDAGAAIIDDVRRIPAGEDGIELRAQRVGFLERPIGGEIVVVEAVFRPRDAPGDRSWDEDASMRRDVQL